MCLQDDISKKGLSSLQVHFWQALDSADATKLPQPAYTDTILYILEQMQSEDLSGSLFDHQVSDIILLHPKIKMSTLISTNKYVK